MRRPATDPEDLDGRLDGSPSGRLRAGVIVAVCALPFLWAVIAFAGTPSDGTLVVPSSSFRDDRRWSEADGVLVRTTYGDTELAALVEEAQRDGSQLRVLAVEGRSLADWRDHTGSAEVGDRLDYRVAVDGEEQTVEVTLRPYPMWDVVRANPGALLLWVGLALSGAFVFWRRPRDPAAQSVLALAALVPTGMTTFPAGLQVIDLTGGRGLWPYVVGDVANALAWATMLFFTTVFPERMPALTRRPWLRPAPFVVPLVLYAVWLAARVPSRPPGLPRDEVLVLVSAPSALVVLPLTAGMMLLRARGARTREHRLALRIVLSSILAALVLYVLLWQVPDLVGGRLAELGGHLAPIALTVPLVGFVVAVLRYRLYEMDLIIRRSLLAVVATAVFCLLFVGLAALVEPWVPDTGLGPLLAGGLLAALLVPFGRVLARLVSRWIFGDRDDPYKVVSELRDVGSSEAIHQTLTDALQTLARNLRLSYAAIDVDAPEDAGPISVSVGTPHRRPTVVELRHGGRPWGRLTLGVARGREPLGPRDDRLLGDVAGQLGALVESLVMNQALRRSRERIVSAREEERRRLRRDLHDGLGPALAMQSMQLDHARALLEQHPERVAPLLAQVAQDTRANVGEVRRLVDDLRPQALDQLGLATALRERASGWSGQAMRCTVEAGDLEPLPAAVEVAAYRIVLEAVNNAAKHSGASECRVELAREDGSLHVRVSDNGGGLPATPRAGVGLGSMRERAEELGGRLTVTTAPDSGTTVAAQLPIDPT